MTSTTKPTAIHLNQFDRQWQHLQKKLSDIFQDVGMSGKYILDSHNTSLEAALQEYVWPSHFMVTCGSGLSALEIALMIAGVGRGDNVITTPLTAYATTLSILHRGAIPIFVDVDDQGLLDLDELEQLLAMKEGKTFVLPVHLYGFPLDYKKLQSLKKRYDFILIEDCAQSAGSASHGKTAGTAADMLATSFYPTKNLGGLGDGGACGFQHQAQATQAKAIRNYGQTARYVHAYEGTNSRLSEIQAAMLLKGMLPKLQTHNRRRQQIATHYLAHIMHPDITLIHPKTHQSSNWHLFPILVEYNRDGFLSYLESNNIFTVSHYPVLTYHQPAFPKKYRPTQTHSQASHIAKTEVSVPVHPYLTDNEVDYICHIINAWKP